MKYLIPITTVAVLMGAGTAKVFAEPAGAVFPGNEAVRIADGKRVVEAPPLTKAMARSIKAGVPLRPPTGMVTVYMIEGRDALMECGNGVLSESSCIAPTLGKTKLTRYWSVKLNGVWVYCTSRASARTCEPVAAGAPMGMPTAE